MFEIYLPIAEVNINLITLTIVSLFAGFFSGLLGIGGGWIITPILIFLGIPPTFAVANGANNVLAASVSGSLSHWFKGQLDIKMGLLISVGGIVGSFIGIFIFKFFFVLGVVNNLIYILYCIFLTSIGISMLIESLVEIRRISQNRFIRRKLHKHYWVHNLPFKIRLHKSHLYISIIPPIFFWSYYRNYVIINRCRRWFFASSDYDLYSRYACPISARYISFYNDIYYDIRCTASRNKPRYR